MPKGMQAKKFNNIQSLSVDPSSVLVIDSFPGDQIILRKKTSRTCYEIILFFMFVMSLLIGLFYIIINPLINRVSILFTDQDIIKSITDNKKYSIIRLNNGLEAVLISEPSLKLSAVSLSVGIGGKTNETDLIGIGHLSEHLMVHKSKHYNRTAFLNRIARNFGYYSSLITDDTTSFFYEIGNDAFKTSLKEFADMIHNPIIDNEMIFKAIDSIEAKFINNNKNVKILESQIISQVSLKDYSYFPNGNQLNYNKTNKILIDTVKHFNSKYYTGSNIKLVVMSHLSIEQIKGLIIKHFHKFNKTSEEDFNKKIISKQNMSLGKLIKYTTNYGSYLNFVFYIDTLNQPDHSECYLKYIQYMLRDKKKGSLSYLLRKESYITALSSAYHVINKLLIKFTINLQLTQGGEVNVVFIIKETFNLLKRIRDHKVEYGIYDDIKQINHLNFYYDSFPKEYYKFVNEISLNMFQFKDDLKTSLFGKYYIKDFNETSIKYYLNQFKADNSLILYGSKYNFTSEIIRKLIKQGRNIDSKWSKEKWYETLYVYGDLTNLIINELNTNNKSSYPFNMRERNPYISQINHTIKEEEQSENSFPINLFNISHIKVWFKVY